jgi:predicted MFS family arabinose efflux permease
MNPFSRLRARPLARQLLALMVVRVLINTPHRMVYPFLNLFASSLGISPGTFSGILAARSLLGAASPALSWFGDRRGRRQGMLLGISLFTAGVLLIAVRPGIWTFVAGLLLAGAGKFTLDPVMQAFMGDRIPFERRGRAVAIVELSWSLSYLVGVPAAGLLIARGGWLAPFPFFAALGFAGVVVLALVIPPDRPPSTQSFPLLKNLGSILRSPFAAAGIMVGLLISAANEVFSVVFGLWLGDSFGFQLAALSGASFLIGGSELLGESIVGFFTDRLGVVKAVGLGILLNCVSALLLPLTSSSQVLAFAGLFLFYVTFEFTLVSSLTLVTELSSEARATLMGLNISAISLGRAAADLVALPLFTNGIAPVLLVTIVLNLVALVFLRRVRL